MRFAVNRVWTAIIFILLLAATAVASDWDRGVALYTKGNYQAALVEFQDIVMERPDAAGAWYYIGLCQFKLKRYDHVELALSHAIDLLEIQTPSSTDIAGAWYTIGISHYLQAHYDTAIEPLKRYIDITSKARHEVDASARTALARSYFFLERYDEALPLLAGGATEKSTTPSPERAKEIAAKLIEEIGFAAVDTGFLHEGGRQQQPGTPVYNQDLTSKQAATLLAEASQR